MSRAVKIALIVVAAVIVLGAGACAVLGAHYKASDKVYPNVYVDGISLGGMTRQAAEAALEDAGYPAEEIAVTMAFPDASELVISSESVGISRTAPALADKAMEAGREGSIFTALFDYIKSMKHPTEITTSSDVADSNKVLDVISQYLEQHRVETIASSYDIKEDKIVLVRGSAGMTLDAQEVYDQFISALADAVTSGKSVTVRCTDEEASAADMDFDALYELVHRDPVAAMYDPETEKVTESVRGVSFDKEAAKAAYLAADAGATIDVPLVFTDPDYTAEQLESMIFRDVLASADTTLSGSPWGRTTNITLAAEKCNGVILQPGEAFSFNGTVGERTSDKGYQPAVAYAGGKSVLEYGGGICQVASTLYYCTLYADLEVLERENHMFIIDYLPLGQDATVNWGTIDYSFRNTTDFPMKIESYVSDDYLHVRFYGTKTGDEYIKVESYTVGVDDFAVIYKEDKSLDPGEEKVDTYGHTGYTVDVYKYTYDGDGNQIDEEFLHRDVYDRLDKIILRGPDKPEEPEEPEEPTEPETPDEPTEPEKPDEPTEPTDPEKPDEPTEPEKPDEPTEPTDPEKPDEPTEPTEPEKPDEPTEPTDPEKPDEPTEPAEPDEPTEPETPADTDTPSESDTLPDTDTVTDP